MTQQLANGFRVNWWQIIEDLRRTGLSVEGISDATCIPKSTLLGYRNLDAEITVERSGDYRSATITKLKDGEGEGSEFAFTLDSVNLGTTPKGMGWEQRHLTA